MNNRLSVRDRKKRPVLFAIVLVILLAILSGLSLFLEVRIFHGRRYCRLFSIRI